MKRWLLVGLLVAAIVGLFCGTSHADNITVISASTIDLDHVQSRTFSNIPPIDPGTKRVKLCFKMRSDTPNSTGFSYGRNCVSAGGNSCG